MKNVRIKKIYILAILSCAVAAVFFCVGATPAGEHSSAEQAVMRIKINASGREFVYDDRLIQPSDFTVAEQIEARKINAPLDQKIAFVDNCLQRGADHKTALGICFPLLVRKAEEAVGYMYRAPQNAKAIFNGGNVAIVAEKCGAEVDEQRLYASIYCCIKFSGGGAVTAYTRTITPKLCAAELKANLVRRGEYTTEYAKSTADRAHNVSLSLGKLDGAYIAAGETFSFNAAVGERTEKNGYKKAKIIVDGKYTDGIGGGVCQASTAVYNASLAAGLSCVANAHSICPSYCPAGLDAMVSSSSDLLITNTTAHTVYFSVCIRGVSATVRVYGEPPEYTIKPVGEVTSTTDYATEEFVDTRHKYFDDSATRGDRLLVSGGVNGVKSDTFLEYRKNGNIIKRVKIRSNEYKCVPQLIAVAP